MKELPKGCKLKLYADGGYGVVNDSETHEWYEGASPYYPPCWQHDPMPHIGRFASSSDAIQQFHATYTGQPIPGGTDAPWAKDGPLARITPEADEQVDRKARTLTQIDAALEDFFQWRDTTNATLQYLLKRETAISHDTQSLMKWSRQDRDRLDELETSLDRLIAARVPNPCEPSKATGENELATDIMCADRQRFLASVCDSCRAVVRAMLSKGDIPGVVNTKHV